jgi:hypothetical protein
VSSKAAISWYRGRESNPHTSCDVADFKSAASPCSATPARWGSPTYDSPSVLYLCHLAEGPRHHVEYWRQPAVSPPRRGGSVSSPPRLAALTRTQDPAGTIVHIGGGTAEFSDFVGNATEWPGGRVPIQATVVVGSPDEQRRPLTLDVFDRFTRVTWLVRVLPNPILPLGPLHRHLETCVRERTTEYGFRSRSRPGLRPGRNGGGGRIRTAE